MPLALLPFANALPGLAPAFAWGGWIQVDILQAVRDSDAVGWICLIALFIFSVYSLGIIFRKAFQFHRAHSQTSSFANRIKQCKGDLASAFTIARDYSHSPLAQMLTEAYAEMEMGEWIRKSKKMSPEERTLWLRDNLERVLGRSIETEMRALEGSLAVLATTANVCPFIGLFGTVWGVLGAFQAIGATGSASIQALAPGVSTALITTIAGLTAAIPSVIAYNIFISKLTNIGSRMESFSSEIISIFLERAAMAKDE